MDLSSAADELYAVAPDAFVEARTRLARQARQDGDAALAKRIAALRRPAPPAWAVNLLARSARDDLGRLLDVGAEIREAWGSGGGLGDLERRRAGLVQELVRTAAGLASDAGRPLRDQALRDVEDTLQAATVDAGIAEEVREGRLTRPRSHSGFVPAGFQVAPDGARPERSKPERSKPERPGRGRPVKKARPAAGAAVVRTSTARAKRAESLRRRAEEAEAALADAREKAGRTREAAEKAAAEVGRLRHELERAVAERDAAARRAERAGQAHARAEDAAREAREAAGEARAAADRDAGRG
ncbi:hypothetical protein AGRA3207_000805 [Actinomadura graeca]|uniref:Colicin import membrane protein n=1 Tax=Actinomadura graeca TaxID=2750812 RepID=A0ABX8QPR8_9ACTN|nr:hypothetical protein [Actinomadura graeca]QXJ20149.1 hypothetical protein AGRA3207_000805 [Actinomadura graeca]